jgi:predicted choloylglycine hydrolase
LISQYVNQINQVYQQSYPGVELELKKFDSNFQQDVENYDTKMQAFVQGLIDKKYACSLVLKNEKDTIIAQTSQRKRNRCGSVAYTAVKSKIFLSAFLPK